MLMHFLVHKNAKNNSMKGKNEGSLYVALEGAPKIFFKGVLKIPQKGEERDTFDVVIDVILDSAIESAGESAPKDALNDLCKDAQEVIIIFESNQNVVIILNCQLLLTIFNLPLM